MMNALWGKCLGKEAVPADARGSCMQNPPRRATGHAVLAALVVGAACIMTGCGGDGTTSATSPTVTGLTVGTVDLVSVERSYEAHGTVLSDRTTVIASRVMASVTAVNVREGDTVREGQVLITLDDSDARQRLRAAETAVDAALRNKELADTTWRRYRALYETQAVSRQDMDRIQAARDVAAADYERARAMADEARTFLSFTRIVASHPGVVTGKHTDVGSMASPGVPLLTIEGLGRSHVEVHADEGFSGTIRPGMAVRVKVDALGKTFDAEVTEVIPDIDASTRTFRVKIDTTRVQGLKPGMFARVTFPVGTRDVLVVPHAAVVHRGQLQGVYVVGADNRIVFRLIREGAVTHAGVEVLSGLRRGERIIVAGVERAVDGARVSEGPR